MLPFKYAIIKRLNGKIGYANNSIGNNDYKPIKVERRKYMKGVLFYILLLSLTLSLVACGNGKSTQQSQTESQTKIQGNTYGNSDLQNLKTAVVDVLGENYWPNMSVDTEELADVYGITEDMYDDYLAEIPLISTNVDTLIIVKAKEGQVSAVEEALNAYRDNMVNSTSEYPMNLGKIQASRIEVFNNYVCFVQLGADVVDAMDQGEDVVINQCQEENEKALEAIRIVLENQ
ncbi:MAG TPA: DUF4358 domain-containing protein [Lachnospiraceae bacterium]|nr:DUF4358 domain-containing protein [Lachnospiraceae bacterium]